MKLGIVSDIHCNAAALRKALAMMGQVDEILCAGDVIYEYRFSNEVVRILRERGVRMVLGNHEAVFLGPQGERARTSERVDKGEVRFLQETPLTMITSLNSKRFYMVHGSPWEPYNEYLFANNPKLNRLPELESDIVILGHTHLPMAKRIGRTLVVNPGSAGEARGYPGDGQLTYAVLDTLSDEVTFGAFADPSR